MRSWPWTGGPTLASRVLLVGCLVGIIGCSRVKLAYSWLDWVLERQVDQYLALTAEQKAAATAAIASYLSTHRTTMLPRYAAFLRQQARTVAAGPLTATTIAAADATLTELYRQTASGLVGVTASLLTGQTPDQIDHLAVRLRERHAELVEEVRQPEEERLAETTAEYGDLLSDWVGRLNEDQRRAISIRVRELHRDPEPWLTERVRRNAAVTAALRAGASRAQLTELLGAWWLGTTDPAAPAAYEVYRREFGESMRRLFRDLLLSLDERQRTHLAKRLDSYAEDFEALAGR